MQETIDTSNYPPRPKKYPEREREREMEAGKVYVEQLSLTNLSQKIFILK